MMQYPLIKKLGLDYYTSPQGLVVLASELEKVLASAPAVYSFGSKNWNIERVVGEHTNAARLLLIEEIVQSCEHETGNWFEAAATYICGQVVRCVKCKAELRPTKWEAV